MSEDDHSLRTIFLAALEIEDPAERAAHLDRACAGDAALRREVEELLKSHTQAGSFLPENPLQTSSASPALEGVGDRIGRYKLLQKIGEGGCGVVYLAEQETPVRRKVALKVIKLGMDTRQVIARFEAERQALAVMDHPNIAKVLDAGASDQGRPFFVMELVRGVKITEHCEKNELSTRERLRLFIQVCQAVQHAHQKGIIHRDLKPSNILVTANDGPACVKVIDFGIAKATEGRLTDQTVFTALEQFLGTPAYMSPEQATMASVDIDTRTDIYSLGVLLYELLTGTTPFDTKELLAAGLDEMRRTIRELEPPRPSIRLTQSASTPNPLQQTFNLVRGDLDWIVMKCLEKDRARRYETANGLAADIERHLQDQPIAARPPGRVYTLRKMVRRNKVTFAMGALLAATLVIALGVMAWLFFQEKKAYRRLSGEVKLRELKTSAANLQGLGKFKEAEPLCVEILSRAKELLGPDDIDVANLSEELATVYLFDGKASDAERLYRDALRIRRKALGENHLAVVNSLEELANLARNQDRLDESADLYREALSVRRILYGNESVELTLTLVNLEEVMQKAGKLGEAESLSRQAVNIDRKARGDNDPRQLPALEDLSYVLEIEGKLAESETFCRQCLECTRSNYPFNETMIAINSTELTAVLVGERKYEEATPIARQSLGLCEERIPDNWRTFHLQSLLGQSLLAQTNYAEAEKLLLSGYDGMKQRESKSPEKIGPELKKAAESLAHLYEMLNRPRDVEKWRNAAVALEGSKAKANLR